MSTTERHPREPSDSPASNSAYARSLETFDSADGGANPTNEFARIVASKVGKKLSSDNHATMGQVMYPAAAICIILLTLLAGCYSLYFSKAVMLPIIGAFLLNFLFSPLVARLHGFGIPNFIASLLVIGLTLGVIAVGIAFAYTPAQEWISNKDKNLAIVEFKLRSLRQPLTYAKQITDEIDKLGNGGSAEKEQVEKPADAVVQKSSASVDQDAAVNTSKEVSQSGTKELSTASVVPVEVQQPSISNRIFSTTGDVLTGVSLMLVLLFYLLSAGDRGLGKLVKLMPTFEGKKRTVELSRAIEKSISDYLFTTTLINAGLGIIIGVGMWSIGMPNPILWGVMAMLLNYFPFVGAIIGGGIVFLAGVVSFDSIVYAAWAPAIYLGVNLVEANLITPVLLGRSVSLHPVWLMIFFVIVSWVWGLGGALIAVPVLAVIKISCDHIEPLMPVGEFLGR